MDSNSIVDRNNANALSHEGKQLALAIARARPAPVSRGDLNSSTSSGGYGGVRGGALSRQPSNVSGGGRHDGDGDHLGGSGVLYLPTVEEDYDAMKEEQAQAEERRRQEREGGGAGDGAATAAASLAIGSSAAADAFSSSSPPNEREHDGPFGVGGALNSPTNSNANNSTNGSGVRRKGVGLDHRPNDGHANDADGGRFHFGSHVLSSNSVDALADSQSSNPATKASALASVTSGGAAAAGSPPLSRKGSSYNNNNNTTSSLSGAAKRTASSPTQQQHQQYQTASKKAASANDLTGSSVVGIADKNRSASMFATASTSIMTFFNNSSLISGNQNATGIFSGVGDNDNNAVVPSSAEIELQIETTSSIVSRIIFYGWYLLLVLAIVLQVIIVLQWECKNVCGGSCGLLSLGDWRSGECFDIITSSAEKEIEENGVWVNVTEIVHDLTWEGSVGYVADEKLSRFVHVVFVMPRPNVTDTGDIDMELKFALNVSNAISTNKIDYGETVEVATLHCKGGSSRCDAIFLNTNIAQAATNDSSLSIVIADVPDSLMQVAKEAGVAYVFQHRAYTLATIFVRYIFMFLSLVHLCRFAYHKPVNGLYEQTWVIILHFALFLYLDPLFAGGIYLQPAPAIFSFIEFRMPIYFIATFIAFMFSVITSAHAWASDEEIGALTSIASGDNNGDGDGTHNSGESGETGGLLKKGTANSSGASPTSASPHALYDPPLRTKVIAVAYIAVVVILDVIDGYLHDWDWASEHCPDFKCSVPGFMMYIVIALGVIVCTCWLWWLRGNLGQKPYFACRAQQLAFRIFVLIFVSAVLYLIVQTILVFAIYHDISPLVSFQILVQIGPVLVMTAFVNIMTYVYTSTMRTGKGGADNEKGVPIRPMDPRWKEAVWEERWYRWLALHGGSMYMFVTEAEEQFFDFVQSQDAERKLQIRYLNGEGLPEGDPYGGNSYGGNNHRAGGGGGYHNGMGPSSQQQDEQFGGSASNATTSGGGGDYNNMFRSMMNHFRGGGPSSSNGGSSSPYGRGRARSFYDYEMKYTIPEWKLDKDLTPFERKVRAYEFKLTMRRKAEMERREAERMAKEEGYDVVASDEDDHYDHDHNNHGNEDDEYDPQAYYAAGGGFGRSNSNTNNNNSNALHPPPTPVEGCPTSGNESSPNPARGSGGIGRKKGSRSTLKKSPTNYDSTTSNATDTNNNNNNVDSPNSTTRLQRSGSRKPGARRTHAGAQGKKGGGVRFSPSGKYNNRSSAASAAGSTHSGSQGGGVNAFRTVANFGRGVMSAVVDAPMTLGEGIGRLEDGLMAMGYALGGNHNGLRRRFFNLETCVDLFNLSWEVYGRPTPAADIYLITDPQATNVSRRTTTDEAQKKPWYQRILFFINWGEEEGELAAALTADQHTTEGERTNTNKNNNKNGDIAAVGDKATANAAATAANTTAASPTTADGAAVSAAAAAAAAAAADAAPPICTEQYGYELVAVHEALDVQIIIAVMDTTVPVHRGKEPRIVVSFRGSTNLSNFEQDVRFTRVRWSEMPAKSALSDKWVGPTVHQGFLNVWSALRHFVLTEVQELHRHMTEQQGPNGKPPTVYLTGHSLGGAIATLCAYAMKKTLRIEPIVYTFGAPIVGNKGFKDEYNREVPRTFRVVNESDMVVSMTQFGGRHVGIEAAIDRMGNFICEPMFLERWLRPTQGKGFAAQNHLMDAYAGSLNAIISQGRFGRCPISCKTPYFSPHERSMIMALASRRKVHEQRLQEKESGSYDAFLHQTSMAGAFMGGGGGSAVYSSGVYSNAGGDFGGGVGASSVRESVASSFFGGAGGSTRGSTAFGGRSSGGGAVPTLYSSANSNPYRSSTYFSGNHLDGGGASNGGYTAY